MAGLRIGYPATSRTPPQERVLGFVLLCLFLAFAVLLVGACNSQERLPATASGGSSGGGGAGALAGGLGGSGAGGVIAAADAGGCISTSSGCVSSCSTGPFMRTTNTCVSGMATCPDGYVPLSSCAFDACAQLYRTCCDATTGVTTSPSCGADGHFTCPAGNEVTHRTCVPASLGVSDCAQLGFGPCSPDVPACSSLDVYCSCSGHANPDGGLNWVCMSFIP
jgi:hypothetical protein